MHILVIGAAGMVGRKLATRLARDGALGGRPVEALGFRAEADFDAIVRAHVEDELGGVVGG